MIVKIRSVLIFSSIVFYKKNITPIFRQVNLKLPGFYSSKMV